MGVSPPKAGHGFDDWSCAVFAGETAGQCLRLCPVGRPGGRFPDRGGQRRSGQALVGAGGGAAPSAASRAAQNGWSPIFGTLTVGTPARRPAAVCPRPHDERRRPSAGTASRAARRFGPPRDRTAAIAVLRRAVALGIDHLDTALAPPRVRARSVASAYRVDQLPRRDPRLRGRPAMMPRCGG